MIEQYNELLKQLDEGLITQKECIEHMVVIAMLHGCKEKENETVK